MKCPGCGNYSLRVEEAANKVTEAKKEKQALEIPVTCSACKRVFIMFYEKGPVIRLAEGSEPYTGDQEHGT